MSNAPLVQVADQASEECLEVRPRQVRVASKPEQSVGIPDGMDADMLDELADDDDFTLGERHHAARGILIGSILSAGLWTAIVLFVVKHW